jgi:hypothetical protein
MRKSFRLKRCRKSYGTTFGKLIRICALSCAHYDSCRYLHVLARNTARNTVETRTLPPSDLLRLFPNVQYLSLDWDLQIVATAQRLPAPIPLASFPSPPMALYPNLTTLALDFTGLYMAKGFGSEEMTMLFRHVRLYNLQKLKVKMRPTDTEDSDDIQQWLVLYRALERMQFPLLKTVNIEIELPVYETSTLVISVNFMP